MKDRQDNWTSKYDHWSATRPDEWLAKVLRDEDLVDIDLAMQILRERYQPKFERYIARKLPEDWVEDVTQEVWAAFYDKIRVEAIKTGVSNFLWTLARNKRADAVRRLTAERNIENDIPLGWNEDEDSIEIESLEAPIEESLEKQIQRQFLPQVPFIGSLLSDCERVLWILREQLDYPSPVVARLTNKQPQTVYSALHNARKTVIKFVNSEEFYLMIANQESQKGSSLPLLQSGALIVERFSNCITPQFTPDELKPLALTSEEFRANFVASLLLPREPEGEAGHPSLVLTRRSEWDDLQNMFEQLYQNRENTDWLSPEECLLKIDLDNENIVLTVEQMLEFLPEPEAWQGSQLSENTYFSVHSPRLRIPVTLGFFDSGLYDEALRERWPFLPEDAGL